MFGLTRLLSSQARGTARLFALATTVASLGWGSCVQAAETFATSRLVISFAPGVLIASPALEDGVIVLSTADGTHALVELPGVVQLEHMVRVVSTGTRRIEGPYIAHVLDSALASLQLPLSTLPEYVSRLDPLEEHGKLAGEHVPSLFPDANKTFFCSGQQHLHRRLATEASLVGDICWQTTSLDHDMDLPQAWGITMGAPDVLVAVLDTGFDWTHPVFGAPGPPEACAPEDSIFHYRDGVIFTNEREIRGDDYSNLRPGLAEYDDDHDGPEDEDSLGRDWQNDRESDVYIGTVDLCQGTTIYDFGAGWAPGALVNKFLYLGYRGATKVRIIQNSSEVLTAEPFTMPGFPGFIDDDFSDTFSMDSRLRIGDGLNNNETFADEETDDEGWLNDLQNDDDENGAEDDVHGYDFIDLNPEVTFSGGDYCPHEDYWTPDNNVFSHSAHGTTLASMIATSLSVGNMMGVTSNVRILPIRVGEGYLSGGNCEEGDVYLPSVAAAIQYAMTFKPDVICFALDKSVSAAGWEEILQQAASGGAVVICGAGNGSGSTGLRLADHWLKHIVPSVLVAGVDAGDVRWVDDLQGQGSNYGEIVDISARAGGGNIPVAKPTENGQPRYDWWSGTSLSGPIVAGVVALIKSAYPHMGRDDLIWMLTRGVDDIYDVNPELADLRELGAGRVNAYRALTLYGNVAAVQDTVWTHELWVGGDVLVPAGRTLTLGAGTIVNVAVDDLLSTGVSGAQVEFVINGTMVVEGTPAAPVTFRVFEEGGASTEYVLDTVVSGKTFTMDNLPSQVAKYVDVSTGSGLGYVGTPYAAATLNINGDNRGDLLITSSGGPAQVYAGYLPGSDPDAPRFAPAELSGTPLYDCRGVAVGDFDNDGYEDFFLTHAATPRLYRSDGVGGFDDVTAELVPASLADNSTAACWIDVDRDGWLDLYVVRSGAVGVPTCSSVSALQHRLFRNTLREGGGFVDVTASAGLSGVADLAALSVCAADVDGDRDIDLFVPRASTWPGGGAPHSLLLINDGTGVFADATATSLGEAVASCPAAEFADMDHDGDVDLVVANDTGAPRLFLNDGNGSYLSDPEIIDAPEGHAGLKVFDQNLDGLPDILLLARDASHSCCLFANRGDKSFVAMSTIAGLQTHGPVSAVVATDFNGDGDADLFLGRPVSAGEFLLRSGSQDGAPDLGRNYVKVKLVSEECGNNSAGIGACVTVTAGSMVQTLSPDGGSARGSQGDRTLVFGLGDYSGPVSAKVDWPGGWTTEVASLTISNATSGETVNVIADDTSPTVSNVFAASLADPNTGNLIWQFTWETDVSCDPSKDMFLIDQAGLPIPCLPGWGEITPQSGLTHVYQSKTTGGYTHKFLEVSEPCTLNCRIKYSATSAAGTHSDTSALQSRRILVCPSQN